MIKLLTLATTVFVAVSLAAQTPKQASTQANTPKVQRASWVEASETYFGISRDDFKAMGLFKLSTEEYGKVLAWDFKRVSDATEKGKASNLSTTHSCGRNVQDEASATKINLMVDSAPNTPPELVSGVNQRFRSMSDVQIVYERSDADLVVSLMGFVNHLESSNRAIGFVSSTVTSSPCVSKLGTNSWNFEMKYNHYLNSGPDVDSVIRQIVTALDANDFEDVRKEHASMKKLFKPQQ